MNEKILNINNLYKVVSNLKLKKKIIVTTNGTFDLIHPAHLNLLNKAKKLGDVLMVLVNGDQSVKRLKGYKRPILKEKERSMHLANFTVVDYVIIFKEDKPLKLLKMIKPQIHVKGGSYLQERIAEEKNS
jgi:rfaE bifunctional protein nucleotidyltransferase chain/domain